MTVVRQNIMSTVMLKNDKLSNEIVRLHLATPEICQAKILSIDPRIYYQNRSITSDYIGHIETYLIGIA